MFIEVNDYGRGKIRSINIFHITDFYPNDTDENHTNICINNQKFCCEPIEDYSNVSHKINQAKEEFYQALEAKRKLPFL